MSGSDRGEAKSVHSGISIHSGYSRGSRESKSRLSINGQPKNKNLRGLIQTSKRGNSLDHVSLTFENQVTLPKKPYCSCRFTKIFLSITAVSAVVGGTVGVILSEVKPDYLAWTGLKPQWENDLAAAAIGFAVSAASVLLGRAFWWCCCNKPRLYSDRTEPLLSMNQGLGMVRAASGLSLPDMGTQRPVLSKQSSFLSVARSTQPSRRTASVNHPSIQEFCI